jgi:deoxycytidylate deaminase
MNEKFIKFLRLNILQTFKDIKLQAEKNQVCKRKAVGCAIIEIDTTLEIINKTFAINGPSGNKNECQNIVGACGCSHAEPRAIMNYLLFRSRHRLNKKENKIKTILLTTYSSCVNCANIIIDSGVIDAVAYEILAPYWAEHPRNAKAMLDRTMPHWTKELIENPETGITLLKDWLNI